jgi:NTP pyrophosphatase (non-canonical NTP hydrolase)
MKSSMEYTLAYYQGKIFDKLEGTPAATLQALNQTFSNFNEGGDTAALRAKLIREEANELVDALFSGSREDVLKEICDLLVVTIGTAVIYDFPLGPAFNTTVQDNIARIQKATVNEHGKLVKDKKHPKLTLEHLFT